MPFKYKPDHCSRINVVALTGGNAGLSKPLVERYITATARTDCGHVVGV